LCYTNAMKKLVPVIIIVALAAAYGIYWYGTQKGEQKADELTPLVEMAFPKPAEVINVINGTVTAVYGATLAIEIENPEDYLPHADGSLRATSTRQATMTPNTVITIDSVSGSAAGTSADIKVGSAITVRTDANIRTTDKFDAIEISVMQ